MADAVTARNEGQKFTPHPEGAYAAKCVDVVNLGERVETYLGKTRVQPKVAIVFRTGEARDDGTPFDISVEHTVSMYDRANLRKFLEAWRGKVYTEEQVEAGVPIDKLEGAAALINVAHRKSQGGRMYGKILTIMPLPKGMLPPTLPDYERPAFWQERKDEYAAALAAHRGKRPAAQVPAGHSHDEGDPGMDEMGDDSDLPF